MLEERINSDIKKYLLGGDKNRAEVLRGIKSALLYEKIKHNNRDEASDEMVLAVLSREVKKRLDAIEIYTKASALDRIKAEQFEKDVISEYLPKQLTDEELTSIVASVIKDSPEDQNIGKIINLVKTEVGASADAGRIARSVKQALQKG